MMPSDLLDEPLVTAGPSLDLLDRDLLISLYDYMVKGRLLEERLIYMFKQNQGFFWIGGPGEEAFNVALGLQVNRGQGPDFDYLHLHYRSSAIMLAMGMDPAGPIRQMKNTATDPYSGGRNFSSHYSIREWNLTPINSPIEVQYLTSIGTGIAQKDHGGNGVTIVVGGDAGTAEGDFASALVWASRPGNELPMLMIVTNNRWGISTEASTQHGDKSIADRGKAFGIKTMQVNGHDPVESYLALKEALTYCRTERKPLLMEASVARLYGHSSASGATRQPGEDPLPAFEARLIEADVITAEDAQMTKDNYDNKFKQLAEQVKSEPQPDPGSIYDYTYWQQTGRTW